MNFDELLYSHVDLSTDDGVDAVREKIRSLNVSKNHLGNLLLVNGTALPGLHFLGEYKQSIGESAGPAK